MPPVTHDIQRKHSGKPVMALGLCLLRLQPPAAPCSRAEPLPAAVRHAKLFGLRTHVWGRISPTLALNGGRHRCPSGLEGNKEVRGAAAVLCCSCSSSRFPELPVVHLGELPLRWTLALGDLRGMSRQVSRPATSVRVLESTRKAGRQGYNNGRGMRHTMVK